MDLTRTAEDSTQAVVVRQRDDPAYQRAVQAHKPAASLYWVWDCSQQRQLLSCSADPVRS